MSMSDTLPLSDRALRKLVAVRAMSGLSHWESACDFAREGIVVQQTLLRGGVGEPGLVRVGGERDVTSLRLWI
jgi:hypothetical protein